MTFESRRTAGRQLAAALQEEAKGDAVVVGITRGGMAVAAEVAARLHLPLDALVVQKICQPGHPHVGVGLVAEPAHLVVNRHGLRAGRLDAAWLDQAVARGTAEVRQRGRAMRGNRARQDLAGRRVIVVDDSAATGVTARAAIRAVRAQGAREVIVALPVAPLRVVRALQRQADRVVCLATPGALIAGAIYYPRPGEISDADICRLLERRSPVAHGAEPSLPAPALAPMRS
jgi:putative phosphoribosyl transferase